jgi:hypothetical protein
MQSDGYWFHVCPEFILTVLMVPSPLRLFAALTGCLCDPIWPHESQIPGITLPGRTTGSHLKGGGKCHGTDRA